MKNEIFDKTIISLSQAEKERVLEFINSIRKPLEEWVNPSSKIITKEFSAEFKSRLLTQHSFQDSPLLQGTFESAFIKAAKAAGMSVKPAPDGGRFWDLELNGKKISLKSTQEKALRADRLKISKLTEAAWIQDCRTAVKRRAETFKLFEDYIDKVDSIIQLRYFQKTHKYEMVEIPTKLFKNILEVPLEYFNSDGPSISIPIGKDLPDFTLKLDRSDAKITILNIRIDVCLVHGSWTLK